MPIELKDAVSKAREVHFGVGRDSGNAPGQHAQDGLVEDMLMSALVDGSKSTRSGRAFVSDARGLWDPEADKNFADQIDNLPGSGEPEDQRDKELAEKGLLEFEDQYTAERVNNRKTEVLTRYVENLILYGTPILNNFFQTIRMDAGTSMGQLREFVDVVESFNELGYYPIDRDRGDIRSFTPGFNQTSQRINPRMQMYGVKVEYESRLHRVLENFAISEILAMLSVGWAQASSEARERDASRFLTNYLSPTTALSNLPNSNAPLGQASGIAINGEPNGTLDVDYDVPRIMDFMEYQEGMNTSDLRMLLPRNAWPFFNMRKGYRRFIGRDGEPLYESPEFEEGPRGALNEGGGFPTNTEQYGVSAQGVGYGGPEAAASYLRQSRQSEAGLASSQMASGPQPFLPRRVPNWMNEFRLPNSAFGPMSVVLTPFAQADHRYYAEGHELREDDVTGNPRPIMTTDALLFDGTRPLYMIESIPPTSWEATNEEHGKSMVVLVEGYAMANRSRGQQAIKLEGLVLDDNYTHEIRLNANQIKMTDHPLHSPSDKGSDTGLVDG